MAELTKVPTGKRYICGLVAFEPGAAIPTEWRGKGKLTDAPKQPARGDRPDWRGLAAQRELADSDAGMARVVDDIVDALVAKGLIALTDLPEAAQAKLAVREQARAKLGAAGK